MSEVATTRFLPGVFPVIERKRNQVIVSEVLEGDRFGRWLIVGKSPDKKRHYRAACDCGTIKELYKGQLIRGNTYSCGCLAAELSSQRQAGKESPMKGRAHTPEAKAVLGAKSRRAWANGCFDTPACKEHLSAMAARQAGTPETGVNAKGVENKAAKEYALRAPNGDICEGKNLFEFVRSNEALFPPQAVKWGTNKHGTIVRGCNAVVGLSKVLRGERPSWRGWTRAS